MLHQQLARQKKHNIPLSVIREVPTLALRGRKPVKIPEEMPYLANYVQMPLPTRRLVQQPVEPKEAPPSEPEVSLDRMQRDTYDIGWEQGELLKAFIRRTKSIHDRPSSAALAYLKNMYKAWKSGDADTDSYAALIDDMLGRQYRQGALSPSESHTSFTRFLKETPEGFRVPGEHPAHWADSVDNTSAILDAKQQFGFFSLGVPDPTGISGNQIKLVLVDANTAEVLAEFDVPGKRPLIHFFINRTFDKIAHSYANGKNAEDLDAYVERVVFVKDNKMPATALMATSSRPMEYQYRLFPRYKVLSMWRSASPKNVGPTAKMVRMCNAIADRYGKAGKIDGTWTLDAMVGEDQALSGKSHVVSLAKYLHGEKCLDAQPDSPPPSAGSQPTPARPAEMVRATREALGMKYADLLDAYYRKMIAMPDCIDRSAMISAYSVIRSRFEEWQRGEAGLEDYEQMLHDTIWQLYNTGRLHESGKATDYPQFKRWLMAILLSKTLEPVRKCKSAGIDAWFLGTIDGVEIYSIDGDQVKCRYFPDFIEGGNDMIYGAFMPPRTAWVDNDMKRDAWKPILMHELTERHLVDKYGYSYDHAHKIANAAEMEFRRILDRRHGKKVMENPNSLGALLQTARNREKQARLDKTP